jgi:hypothetical protein
LKVGTIFPAGIKLVGEFSICGGQKSQLTLKTLVGLVKLGSSGLRGRESVLEVGTLTLELVQLGG